MTGQRLHYDRIAPQARAALLGVEAYLRGSGLDQTIIELVKLRASQINRCGFCLDMHSKAARQFGETEQRIYVLDGWRESTLYTPREQAALAWTEALTNLPEAGAPDSVYEAMQAQFTEKEIVDITVLVAQINAWNRIAIAFRMQHPAAA